MSRSIWTACAGASEIERLQLTALRAVEAQHQVSTRKLVDSLEEQHLLETLIDAAKPPSQSRAGLHVLLATPFRYPPLAHGSRFGTRHEPGIWYGSESQRPLFAEVAYYRFVFMAGTRARFGLLSTWHTTFAVQVRAASGIDLTAGAFAAHRSTIASPVEYSHTQALGADMRRAGVEAVRYPSARDVEGGVNVAVFTPAAFGGARPRRFESWHCTATPHRVEIVRRDFAALTAFVFGREEFEVDGVLPAPAV
jgi:hypothetical protein